jgi:hypothetical protein
MRAALAIALLGVAVLLSGCIMQSLHPFLPEKDWALEPALVGSWSRQPDKDDSTDAEAGQVWTFTQMEGEEKGYDLAISEAGETARFEARVAKLGDTLFLNMAPGEMDMCDSSKEPEDQTSEPMGLYWLHLIPAHSAWRVRLEGDSLKLDALDPDWVKGQVNEKALGLRYETVSDNLILTASPEELREFLLKHAHDDEAFPDCFSLKRQKQAPPEPARSKTAPAA